MKLKLATRFAVISLISPYIHCFQSTATAAVYKQSIHREVLTKSFSSQKQKLHMKIERDATCTVIHPDDGKHSASIILMHGLGDSADGWEDSALMLHRQLPYVKFILPTAEVNPVTMNGGYKMNSWYDIVGLDDRAGESCDGIEKSSTRIEKLLDKEFELGLPYSRIGLAGFSQGGAMTLWTGLQLPIEKKLGGLLVMSGYLPGANKFNFSEGMQEVPILHCHGTDDPVVIYQWAKKTRDFITSKGATNYELKSYPGLPHSVSMDELQYIQAFLTKIFPHDNSFIVKPKSPNMMSIRELKEAIQKYGLSGQAVGFNEKSEYIALLESYLATQE